VNVYSVELYNKLVLGVEEEGINWCHIYLW
jgi:hypothetical protein